MTYTVIPKSATADEQTIFNDGGVLSAPLLNSLPDTVAMNNLKIMFLEAQDAITPIDYESAQVDLITSTAGYSNTVNLADTDALFFNSASIVNRNYNNYLMNLVVTGTLANWTSFPITSTLYANVEGYIKQFGVRTGTNNTTFEFKIIQGGVTLATKSVLLQNTTAEQLVSFSPSDYSAPIGIGTFFIEVNRTGGSGNFNAFNSGSVSTPFVTSVAIVNTNTNNGDFIFETTGNALKTTIDLTTTKTDFYFYHYGSGNVNIQFTDGTNTFNGVPNTYYALSFVPTKLNIIYGAGTPAITKGYSLFEW